MASSVRSLSTSGPRFIFRATAFSNMEIGWQITNPGTRFLLSANGQPVMGGDIVMADAVAAQKMAASQGATGPMIEMNLVAKYKNDSELNAIYHPVRQVPAPGKAFKDKRSPLVLDLDGSGVFIANQ